MNTETMTPFENMNATAQWVKRVLGYTRFSSTVLPNI